ncbi:MAG: ANTAR domain-containing protein [Thermoleophilia bacterium]|nr:ANTAR domain-containing protein [Thermoleophilia bacterium]
MGRRAELLGLRGECLDRGRRRRVAARVPPGDPDPAVNGEWIDIVADSREQADRLAVALREEFDAEIVTDGEHVVRVTPDSETTAKLVNLFHSIGTWLGGCGLASCDVRFGDRSLTLLAPSGDQPGDPTEFLLERTRQLETALTSRIVIEQAKGVLAERHGIGVDEAFERLRRASRDAGRKIHDVAGEVVGRPAVS